MIRLILALMIGAFSCDCAYTPPHTARPEVRILNVAMASVLKIETRCPDKSVTRGTAVSIGGAQLLTAWHMLKEGCDLYWGASPLIVVTSTQDYDVALLQVADAFLLDALPMCVEQPELGEPIWYVGYPALKSPPADELQQRLSVTEGVVSTVTGRYLRITSSFLPGGSGGAVVSKTRGCIAGIASFFRGIAHDMPAVDQFWAGRVDALMYKSEPL